MVVSDPAALPAQGEGRANNRRQPDRVQRFEGAGHAVLNTPLTGADGLFVAFGWRRAGDQARARALQADGIHGCAKLQTILGLFDGLQIGADQFHAMAFQHPGAGQRDGGVKGGLPAHGRQQGIGFFTLDDASQHFRRDWFDIGSIGQIRIGHDRRRIGVDQNDPETFFAQRFARLRPGVIEFTGLSNDDGAGADDQD